MKNLLTIEYTTAYGIELCGARRLTEEEKVHYNPEYRETTLIGTGTHISLPHLKREDMPGRPSAGEFNGCYNQAWIITQEEWDAYLALEQTRSETEAAKAQADEIAVLEQRKASAEAQSDLPSKEEAARRTQDWINVYNEGGEGYVPHIYTRDEYEAICRRLDELKGGADK